jgi:hypothetical protein
MSEEPFKGYSQWPEDIKTAYEHLKIPTLYDSLLANEKLTAAGVVATSIVSLMTVKTLGFAPNVTCVAPRKPVP